MTQRAKPQSGVSNEAAVRELLNEAYEGWGDKEYFRWKYDDYPGYDPDEHVFSITVDDELAAFRRVFPKELTAGGETVPIHIYGDTAVAPPYQGRGLYSQLYKRTEEYSLQSDAELGAAYNRKGTITFEANRDRGWGFQTLPLQLRILSPKAVLETYAPLLIDEVPAIDSIVDIVGHRIHVGTSDGQLTLREIVNDNIRSTGHSIGPALSDTAVTDYVEAVSTDGNTIADLLTTSARLVANGHISASQATESEIAARRTSSGEIDTSVQQVVSKPMIRELVQLYDQTPSYRRTREDVRHLTQYPDSDVVIARRDGTVVGYAVLGPAENGSVTEGRVLEIQVQPDDEAVFDALIERVEQRAVERGFDLVAILSDRNLGEQWAAIDQQVVVWGELEETDRQPLRNKNLQISFYDVV